jgi:hypothetical protein
MLQSVCACGGYSTVQNVQSAGPQLSLACHFLRKLQTPGLWSLRAEFIDNVKVTNLECSLHVCLQVTLTVQQAPDLSNSSFVVLANFSEPVVPLQVSDVSASGADVQQVAQVGGGRSWPPLLV